MAQNSSNRGNTNEDHETRVEAGKKAAETAKAKYGDDFHERIGEKGGEARAAEMSADDYARMGREGGKTAQETGAAHKFTDEERREGGQNSHRGDNDDNE